MTNQISTNAKLVLFGSPVFWFRTACFSGETHAFFFSIFISWTFYKARRSFVASFCLEILRSAICHYRFFLSNCAQIVVLNRFGRHARDFRFRKIPPLGTGTASLAIARMKRRETFQNPQNKLASRPSRDWLEEGEDLRLFLHSSRCLFLSPHFLYSCDKISGSAKRASKSRVLYTVD